MDRTFIFDLDDTLMWTHHLTYSPAKEELCAYVRTTLQQKAYDPLMVLKTLERIEKENIKNMGFAAYGKDRFPKSLVETYKVCCEHAKQTPNDVQLEEVKRIGTKIFDPLIYRKTGLVPGAASTLDWLLIQNDELALVTKGDESVQRSKMKELGLKRWFGKKMYVVSGDKTEKLKQLSEKKDKDRTWYVGNSFHHDMEPVINAGIKGIYIPIEGWGEAGNPEPHPRITVLNSIRDLISKYHNL